MKDVYNQFGKRSKRSEVTRGSNPNKRTSNVLRLPIPPLPPPKFQYSRTFEHYVCLVKGCTFESDSEEGLLQHLHKGHNA